jgi:hypothetical protein
MPILALRDVVNLSLLEWCISVHARDTLTTLKTAVANWFLVSAGYLRNPAWIACGLLLL